MAFVANVDTSAIDLTTLDNGTPDQNNSAPSTSSTDIPYEAALSLTGADATNSTSNDVTSVLSTANLDNVRSNMNTATSTEITTVIDVMTIESSNEYDGTTHNNVNDDVESSTPRDGSYPTLSMALEMVQSTSDIESTANEALPLDAISVSQMPASTAHTDVESLSNTATTGIDPSVITTSDVVTTTRDNTNLEGVSSTTDRSTSDSVTTIAHMELYISSSTTGIDSTQLETTALSTDTFDTTSEAMENMTSPIGTHIPTDMLATHDRMTKQSSMDESTANVDVPIDSTTVPHIPASTSDINHLGDSTSETNRSTSGATTTLLNIGTSPISTELATATITVKPDLSSSTIMTLETSTSDDTRKTMSQMTPQFESDVVGSSSQAPTIGISTPAEILTTPKSTASKIETTDVDETTSTIDSDRFESISSTDNTEIHDAAITGSTSASTVSDGMTSVVTEIVASITISDAYLEVTTAAHSDTSALPTTPTDTVVPLIASTLPSADGHLISTSGSELRVLTTSSIAPYPLVSHTPLVFAPVACPNAMSIGANCNTSNAACDVLKPCLNSGICTNVKSNQHGYMCSCPPSFNGTHCELDYRPCKTDTCWNKGKTSPIYAYYAEPGSFFAGICVETSPSTFRCTCSTGWQGLQCELQVNFCGNVSCLNNAVCKPILLNYTCQCIGAGYSGRHCEVKASTLETHETVTKSFAYVVITALSLVVMLIVMLDILKYCFGVDTVREERRRQQTRSKKKEVKIHTITRYIYIDFPRDQAVDATVEDTSM